MLEIMWAFFNLEMIQIKVPGYWQPRMSKISRDWDRAMKRLFSAAIGVLGLISTAAAQVPAAIVEDLQGKVEGVEFMDYVAPGKVIRLGPKASVVLGYLKSCWRETITGGTVVVGAEQSMVHLGDTQRVKVDCDVNAVQLADREASQSAATTFRSLASGPQAAVTSSPQLTLYGLSPIVEVRGGGTLVVERVDVRGERYTVPIKGASLVRGKFVDFARAHKSLTAGGTYTASLGSRRTIFKIDPGATAGSTPIIGRLLRL
jgi:hypothetical protein